MPDGPPPMMTMLWGCFIGKVPGNHVLVNEYTRMQGICQRPIQNLLAAFQLVNAGERGRSRRVDAQTDGRP